MNRIRNVFGTEPTYIAEAFQMAWPAVLESFCVALAGMVDSLMVSSIGAYAVAAVGLTTQPKFIGLALFTAVNVSVSAIVARRKGQQDKKGANETLAAALTVVVLCGIVVSAVCVSFADPIIRLCGSNADTHESAVIYFRIIMGGMMFNIISLAINAAQRGAGNTRIAMTTNVTAQRAEHHRKLPADRRQLRDSPALGVEGAALATVFGTVVACGMSVASLFRKESFVSHSLYSPEPDPVPPKQSGVHRQYRLQHFPGTAPAAGGIYVHGGDDGQTGHRTPFAAHQVGMNIMSLSFSFGDGMQVAAVALIGRSLGEEKPDMARLYGC